MSRKNLIIVLVVLIAVAAIVALAVALPQFAKCSPSGGTTPSPTETEPGSPTPDPNPEEYAKRFGDFSAITCTIGDDPKTTANITWQSLAAAQTGYVRIYEKSAGSASAAVVTANVFSETLSVPVLGQYDLKNPELSDVKGQIYRCYLTGLKPGTEYIYTAGYEGGAESSEMSFTTASDGDSFSFLLVADTQGFTKRNFDVWETLATLSAEKFGDFDFLIHLGDAVEEGKNHYQWQLFFNAGSKLTCGKQVIDVVGNRDKKHTLLRYTNGASENRTALVSGYYSFDWGSVHFSVLNTGDGDKDLAKSQLKWLESDLAAAEGQTKIILMHKAPYTNANHYKDSEIVALRGQILPVAEKYGVAAVISGHDHYYFRSNPVDGDGNPVPCETETVNISGVDVEMLRSNGTVYFVNGSAGCKQHDNDVDVASGINYNRASLMKGPSFSYVSVSSEKIVFLTYVCEDSKLTLFDAFGIYLH